MHNSILLSQNKITIKLINNFLMSNASMLKLSCQKKNKFKEHDLNSIDLLHNTLITIIIIVAAIEEHVNGEKCSFTSLYIPSIHFN